MNERPNQPEPAGLNLPDIYYTLFRHKWLILTFSLLGIGAAAFLYLSNVKMYRSEAELLVLYVTESKGIISKETGDQVKPADPRGEAILNSEMEILASRDLADQVATIITPEKILAKLGGGSDQVAAATVISRGLTTESPRKSNVIRIGFQHPDPRIAQQVLAQLIQEYFAKHVKIHRTLGVPGYPDTDLTVQVQKLQGELLKIEMDLMRAKTNANVISLELDRKTISDRAGKLKQDLYDTQAELEERTNLLARIERITPPTHPGATTNSNSSTNDTKQLSAYKDLSLQLENFRKKLQDNLLKFTEGSKMVTDLRSEIERLETQKRDMEQANPKLAEINIPVFGTNAPSLDPPTLKAQISTLESKIKSLLSQSQKLQEEAAALDMAGYEIERLQRQKELAEARYRYLSASRNQADVDDSLGKGKLPNISIVQVPTPAFLDASKLQKILLMVLAGGIGAGLGLAFAIELFLDQTVRRPSEIETKLNIPLFVTIPNTSRNGYARKLHSKKLALSAKASPEALSSTLCAPTGSTPQALSSTPCAATDSTPQALSSTPCAATGSTPQALSSTPCAPSGSLSLAPWSPEHPMRHFLDGLRDRTLMHFEKVTRKPKLVAVASVNRGAGVTTIASGLAAALSQTGEGNVLLVDLNPDNGAAHPFYRGKPNCGLQDSLEQSKRDDAQIQDKLFMVSAQDPTSGPNAGLSKKLAGILPKLQTSDYDFVIFDMPPITQTSLTTRLAAHMDLNLFVIESGKTQRDLTKRALGMLAQVKAPVAAVLNKSRTYIPAWLHQEL